MSLSRPLNSLDRKKYFIRPDDTCISKISANKSCSWFDLKQNSSLTYDRLASLLQLFSPFNDHVKIWNIWRCSCALSLIAYIMCERIRSCINILYSIKCKSNMLKITVYYILKKTSAFNCISVYFSDRV